MGTALHDKRRGAGAGTVRGSGLVGIVDRVEALRGTLLAQQSGWRGNLDRTPIGERG